MQRRLALALALTALVTLVLVGLGMLLLAGRGARQDATEQVTGALDALTELAAGERALRDFGPALARSQQAFDFDDLLVVRVDSDGEVMMVANTGRGRGNPPPRSDTSILEGLPPVLEGDDLEALTRGETVVFNPNRGVVGLKRLDVEFPELRLERSQLALVISQRVTALPGRVFGWFLWSSLVVLAGSTLAGVWLARRFVTPIHDVQQTTAAIAGGNFQARTTINGNDELADLGQSVNQMAAELERSKQLDQQFLMSVSHDLRTPLTAIGGYAEALVDGTATDGKAVGSVIYQQAERLERLVQDLLDLARLDANQFQLDLQDIDLAVVAGRTVAGLAPKAAADGMDLAFSRPENATLAVHADPDRLTQVITNLIDNGLKFGQHEVQVAVGASNGWALLNVSDDGPGIPEDDLPHIFDRLYSGKAQAKRAESSVGLGLTIVRELTMAMGGNVNVAPRPGGGTSFAIRLPLRPGTVPAGSP